jgi:hypothetical protein
MRVKGYVVVENIYFRTGLHLEYFLLIPFREVITGEGTRFLDI